MPKYTFLAMAEEVLLFQIKPMSAQEIWDEAVTKGFDKKLGSKGQTPWNSLNARLVVEVRDDPKVIFVRQSIKPARYVLKDKEKSQQSIAELNKYLADNPQNTDADELESQGNQVPEKIAKYPYKERQLHPFVSRFSYYAFREGLHKSVIARSTATWRSMST